MNPRLRDGCEQCTFALLGQDHPVLPCGRPGTVSSSCMKNLFGSLVNARFSVLSSVRRFSNLRACLLDCVNEMLSNQVEPAGQERGSPLPTPRWVCDSSPRGRTVSSLCCAAAMWWRIRFGGSRFFRPGDLSGELRSRDPPPLQCRFFGGRSVGGASRRCSLGAGPVKGRWSLRAPPPRPTDPTIVSMGGSATDEPRPNPRASPPMVSTSELPAEDAGSV